MQSIGNDNVRQALNEREGFQIWWRLMRPHTLTASFVPVFIGTMLAALDGKINWLLFGAMLLACMLIQCATNMFNEYYDFVRGLDNEQSVGIGGTIVRDGIKPKTVLSLALTFYAISMLLGVYICMESSWYIALIGLACMLCGYLYTGGPYPISYTPFGELTSGVFMGAIIICITYYIQTLTLTGNVVLISIPVTIFIACINFANNLRDHDGDKVNGRRTVAILLGRKKGVTFLGICFIASYVITAVFIAVGLLPIWAAITFLSIKKARDAYRGFIGKTMPLEMMPAMKATGQTNTIYGLLLVIALLIQQFVPLSF
ncbi:1,4-dihydroxy-2-naphthoate octaprenyltransferase [Terribacillus saccharophilus]|uniref:1,4-dihydroxy-2-naphthoate polyprenyltransferase n=1 Tax=Terribacillus saccharophilus TaxID=361277 RepID=UPI000BA7CC1C|nr:1,4-dihydroxy-2-naphthoate polyprenyltransferase [Terribacillus saccharophilus]PAF18002.1 1,4-dihydroxy-2-naphthoate octaprenyltransferase [Terribacillus saccharophilus]PAF37539.1 1,4-dihydroxy-2-naphthoate octaprenyltransferase [Terribacillus saccharophilus]